MAKKAVPPRGPQLELAGALGVAFVNTTGAREKNRQLGVASFADLITWCQQAGALSALEAERLRRLAAERPADAAAVFARAKEIRSALSAQPPERSEWLSRTSTQPAERFAWLSGKKR